MYLEIFNHRVGRVQKLEVCELFHLEPSFEASDTKTAMQLSCETRASKHWLARRNVLTVIVVKMVKRKMRMLGERGSYF
jgi:hypothetical protein